MPVLGTQNVVKATGFLVGTPLWLHAPLALGGQYTGSREPETEKQRDPGKDTSWPGGRGILAWILLSILPSYHSQSGAKLCIPPPKELSLLSQHHHSPSDQPSHTHT